MKNNLFILSLLLIIFFHSDNLCAQPGWQWAITNNMSFNGVIEAAPIVTDNFGNAFITGTFWINDSVSFGANTIHGQSSVFLVKCDSNGHYDWALNTTYASDCQAKAMCTDASGNVYLLADYVSGDSCGIGSVTMYNPSLYIMDFVAKIDSSGHVQWAKNIIGSQTYGSGYGGIAVDREGNVYITGSYNLPTYSIGPSTLVNASPIGDSSDIYLTKFDALGNPLWGKSFGGHSNDWPNALTLSASGSIYILGSYESATMTIGTDTLTDSLTGTISSNNFLAKFDNNGNPEWAKSVNRNLELYDLKLGNPDNLFTTGYTSSAITLGSFYLPDKGSVLIDYDTSGNINWANVAVGGHTAIGDKVAPDTCGNVWMAGLVLGILTCDSTIIDTPAICNDPLFIAAYDKCGHYIPGTGHILGSGADDELGLALDNRGNLYTGGDYEDATIVIGPDTLVNPGPFHEYLMLAKYRIGSMPCGSYLCNPATLNTITNQFPEANITVYPNPAFNEFTIQNDHSFAPGDKAELLDMAGRLVGKYALNGVAVEVYLTSLQPGIYQCRIITRDHSVIVKKVVILK